MVPAKKKASKAIAPGIYPQSKGSWSIRVSTGERQGKSYVYHTETFRGSVEAAKRRRAEIMADIARGRLVRREEMTVGQFLDRWLQFIDNTDLAEETKAPYHLHAEKHFKTYMAQINRYKKIPLADLRLLDLSAEILQGYFKWTLENGRQDDQKVKKAERGKPRDRSLSPTTVNAHYRTWHVALEWARGQGWIEHNPSELTKPPRPEKKKVRRLKLGEAKALLRSTKGEWIHSALMVALYTGLRVGEQMALRWEDVDFEEKTVWPKRTLKKAGPNPIIRDKVKNDSSNAPVPLVESVVSELKELKRHQAEMRLAAGPAWGIAAEDGGRKDAGLVFTTPLGTPISRTDINRDRLRPVLDRAGLPRINWHALRHSTGSLLADLGVDIKIISMILRHSTIKITADTYTDPELDVARKALAKVEKAIR